MRWIWKSCQGDSNEKGRIYLKNQNARKKLTWKILVSRLSKWLLDKSILFTYFKVSRLDKLLIILLTLLIALSYIFAQRSTLFNNILLNFRSIFDICYKSMISLKRTPEKMTENFVLSCYCHIICFILLYFPINLFYTM